MASTTPKHSLPYLQGTDLASIIDTGFEDLATELDGKIVTYTSGTSGGYPGVATDYEGSLYYDESEQTLYYAGKDIFLGSIQWLPLRRVAGTPLSCLLTRTLDLTVPTGSTDIEWQVAALDSGQYWSASPFPEELILQHDGLYRVYLQAKLTGNVQRDIQIYDVGSGLPIGISAQSALSTQTFGLEWLVEAQSGDKIKAVCTGAASSTSLDHDYLSISVDYLGLAT